MWWSLAALVLAGVPEVAVLSSSQDVGELRFQPVGEPLLRAPAVRFSHLDGSPVLGAVLPGSRVVVATAVLAPRADPSFAGALLRLEAGATPRVLADGVVYGARPLVTATGRVFIARGTPGPSIAGEPRVDQVQVDEVNPHTGRARVVYAAQGFATFLAGVWEQELLIYELTPAGGRLLAVHADALSVRVLVPHLPVAHDFTVDAKARRVLFTTLQGRAWAVQSVSLRDGATHALVTGPEVTLLPAVMEDGAVWVSAGEGRGLRTLEGAPAWPAQGTGFERVRLARGGWLVVMHERPSDFPLLRVWRAGAPLVVATPAQARLDFAGLLP